MPCSNPLPKLLDLSIISITLGIFDIIRIYYTFAYCACKEYAQNDVNFAQKKVEVKVKIDYNNVPIISVLYAI